MRRNSATLLKYILYAGIFLTVGPIAIKFMYGERDPIAPVMVQGAGGHGMPIDPDVMKIRSQTVLPLKRLEGIKVPEVPNVEPEVHNSNQYKGSKKIDWHDYEAIAKDAQRTGPGEQGSAVILSADEEKKKHDLYKVNGFNAYASDKISLDRSLKDIRHPNCKKQKHLSKLPTISVIVPFHNEHWSTLLRTAHSVLNRSPKHLVHEIILVDDFSSKEHCKKPLDDHVKAHYNGKVKVIHAEKREGLIRTRLLGAKHATGDVLIFLDSHVEAGYNWLPPLLEPIAEDRKTVVCPFIDVLDYETFALRAQDEGARGAFDWEFFYKRLPLLPEDLKNPERPFKSPVMAGGLFAIDRKWFWDMGGYDPGLDIWGGEQYELSFKIWQCGGEMVDAPCSRVGHIYRKFAPFPNPGVGDFVGRNYRRVAEVWMDEYKEHLYRRRPHYRNIDAGDLSAQFAIRKKLNCKPFKWFMKEIAFDLPKYYPPVKPPNFAEGEVRNLANNMCLDTKFKGQNDRFGVDECIKDKAGLGGEQQFEMTWHRDIRPKKRSVCLDVSQSIRKAPVLLYSCHGMQGNQHFKYNLDTHQLLHPISGQCLDSDPENKEIYMNPCDKSSRTQQWKFSTVNATAIRRGHIPIET